MHASESKPIKAVNKHYKHKSTCIQTPATRVHTRVHTHTNKHIHTNAQRERQTERERETYLSFVIKTVTFDPLENPAYKMGYKPHFTYKLGSMYYANLASIA